MAEEENLIGVTTGINIHPFLLAPAIGSVAPSGATVGGPAFTLTVTGSGFTTGSTVTWNGAARATTFVGTTQVTAAILATDIAAVGSASIAVSNPSPAVASKTVSFTIIPNITDIMNTLSTVAGAAPAISGTVANLRTFITNQDAANSTLQSQLSDTQSQVGTLNTQNAALSNTIADQNAQITRLQASLSAAQAQAGTPSGPQTASPLEVAQSLKGVLDQVQTAALGSPGVQTTLTNLNVQVKALLSVDRSSGTAEAQLVFPDPTALPDPNTLSTVSLSFGAIPNLQSNAAAAPPNGNAAGSSSSASPSSSAGKPPPSRKSKP